LQETSKEETEELDDENDDNDEEDDEDDDEEKEKTSGAERWLLASEQTSMTWHLVHAPTRTP